jgi:hypothetical protein
MERGLVDEILMDNSATFRSAQLKEMFKKWNIATVYRAAYRASGNGIVERHHRTIKRMAERSHISPIEAVFWYNLAPRVGQRTDTVPSNSVYRYQWRNPETVVHAAVDEVATVKVGDEVWVKPPNGRCTTRWGRGRVTGVNSRNNICVDGMPRHILDIRRVIYDGSEVEGRKEVDDVHHHIFDDCRVIHLDSEGGEEVNGGQDFEVWEDADQRQEHDEGVRVGRPIRERRQPVRFDDYEMEVEV